MLGRSGPRRVLARLYSFSANLHQCYVSTLTAHSLVIISCLRVFFWLITCSRTTCSWTICKILPVSVTLTTQFNLCMHLGAARSSNVLRSAQQVSLTVRGADLPSPSMLEMQVAIESGTPEKTPMSRHLCSNRYDISVGERLV